MALKHLKIVEIFSKNVLDDISYIFHDINQQMGMVGIQQVAGNILGKLAL